MPYPERIVPHETSAGVLALHETRYRFALPYCAGKRVLDAACGAGYGSALLSTTALEVVGLDVAEDAIAYAREHYAAPNVEFRVQDLLAGDFDQRGFDVVCSFETLEHLPDRDAFLERVARGLLADGVFIVSTPRAEQTTHEPANPHHHVEYSRHDLEALLRRYFGAVDLYGQRRLQTRRHRALQRLDVLGLRRHLAPLRVLGRLATGTAPMQDVSPDEIALDTEHVDDADEIVAVCRRPRR